MDELQQRGLARIDVARKLRLVDLTAQGLARLGADARLCSGSLYLAQRWSRAFFNHPDQPDGICYRSRHDPSRLSVGIFDRARGALQVVKLGCLSDPQHEKMLSSILDRYGFGLV